MIKKLCQTTFLYAANFLKDAYDIVINLYQSKKEYGWGLMMHKNVQ